MAKVIAVVTFVLLKAVVVLLCISSIILYRKLKDVWSLLIFVGLIVFAASGIMEIAMPFLIPYEERLLADSEYTWDFIVTASASSIGLLTACVGFSVLVFKKF